MHRFAPFVRLLTIALVLAATLHPVPTHAAARSSLEPAQSCAFGTTFYTLGLVVEALPLLENGFKSLQQQGNDQAAMCGLWLGALYQSIGDYNSARLAYERSLRIFEQGNNGQMMWTMHYALASIDSAQGNYQASQQRLERDAMPLLANATSWGLVPLARLATASTYNNLGVVKSRQGQYDQGRVDIERALQDVQQLAASAPAQTASPGTDGIDPAVMVTFLRLMANPGSQNNGDMLQELLALALQQQGSNLLQPATPTAEPDTSAGGAPLDPAALLALIQKFQDPSSSSESLFAWLVSANPVGQQSQSSPLTAALGSTQSFAPDALFGNVAQAFVPLFLNNIGETYREQGQFASALTSYDAALQTVQQPATQGLSNVFALVVEGITRNNRGLALFQQGDADAAIGELSAALAIMSRLKQRAGVASVQINLAGVYMGNNDDKALIAVREASDILEELRLVGDSGVVDVTPGTTSDGGVTQALGGALAQFADVYNYGVLLAHREAQHADGAARDALEAEAFRFAERGRARLLQDTLARGQPQFSAAQNDLLQRERQAFVLRQAATDTYNQAALLDPPSPLVGEYQAQKTAAEAAYAEVAAAVATQDNSLVHLLSGQTGDLGLEAVQPHLDTRTTMVVYELFDTRILTDQTGLAFVLTSDSLKVIDLPATTAAINADMDQLATWQQQAAALAKQSNGQSLNRQPVPVLQSLHATLIAPLVANDALSTPQLALVPHQRLHQLPFAALSADGRTMLGDQFDMFELPSASSLALVQQIAASKTPVGSPSALIFGNPALEQAVKTQFRFGNLDAAEQEASTLGQLFQTTVYTGSMATKATLARLAPSQQIVHLAAHGRYSDTNALDSAIYLAPSADNGILSVRDVLTMDFRAAELVTLSACQSNVGNANPADEMISLTRALFAAGSPSVIATLWVVNDDASTMLMTSFYRHWQSGQMSKAAALRAAQNEVRQTYPNPYYWAGFVVNGDPGAPVATFRLAPPATPTPVPTVAPTNAPAPPAATADVPNTSRGGGGDNPRPSGLCGSVLLMFALAVGGVGSRRFRRTR